MHIEAVPNRGSHPTILLRKSYREGRRGRKRTLANLTCLPAEAIETLKRALRGEKLVPCDQAFAIERSIPHGHVKAVLGTMRKIGLDTIIASRRSPQRDLVMAMIAERLLHGCSKLASTRLWHTTTLAEQLSVQDTDVDELYEAMDWLWERQERIEKKLAARHLTEGAQVFYDVSSSYYEGRTCQLARHGHNRDGKKGRPIIVYGVLTDHDGCPVATQVYPGNTGDPSTVADQVNKLRERFGISRVVLVGDRGMLTQTQGTALGHAGEATKDRPRSDPANQDTIAQGRNRPENRESGQPPQDGETLQLAHSRRGVSVLEGNRYPCSSDLPPGRSAGADTRVSVFAGVLCRVAHAPGVGFGSV